MINPQILLVTGIALVGAGLITSLGWAGFASTLGTIILIYTLAWEN